MSFTVSQTLLFLTSAELKVKITPRSFWSDICNLLGPSAVVIKQKMPTSYTVCETFWQRKNCNCVKMLQLWSDVFVTHSAHWPRR